MAVTRVRSDGTVGGSRIRDIGILDKANSVFQAIDWLSSRNFIEAIQKISIHAGVGNLRDVDQVCAAKAGEKKASFTAQTGGHTQSIPWASRRCSKYNNSSDDL